VCVVALNRLTHWFSHTKGLLVYVALPVGFAYYQTLLCVVLLTAPVRQRQENKISVMTLQLCCKI
jgi:hypothetical protein